MNKFFAPFILLAAPVAAQTGTGPEMADSMRQDGKIYVVIAVIALVFLALALFLFYLDRKVRKIEKQVEEGITQKSETARH